MECLTSHICSNSLLDCMKRSLKRGSKGNSRLAHFKGNPISSCIQPTHSEAACLENWLKRAQKLGMPSKVIICSQSGMAAKF